MTDSRSVLVGRRVCLCAPGAWFDGLTGAVLRESDIPGMFTVDTDDLDQPRALARVEEMRILGSSSNERED